MRRILASLFVIAAVIGIGVFATGAYFTDSVSVTNQEFTTGSADLKFGQCGEIGDNCSAILATLDTYSVPAPETTGPDHANSGCLVVENVGNYALNLSAGLDVTAFSHPDMATYFEVAMDQANAGCNPIGTLLGWDSAANVKAASPFSLGMSLAPSGRLYLVLYNRWNSTGNQNYLQNGSITLTTRMDGQTN